MKFIQFNDKKIDSFFFMELADLAKTLAKSEKLEIEFGYKSYFDPLQEKIILSHFWDNRPDQYRISGLKTDVILRSIGSKRYTDYSEVSRYISYTKNLSIPSFAKQLFVVFEDIRLEELCKKERPGTKREFQLRRNAYHEYFEDQLTVNMVKSVPTDALFNYIFLLSVSNSPIDQVPNINENINRLFPFIRQNVFHIFDTKSTKDVVKVCMEIMDVLDEVIESDMLNMYFHLPELKYELLMNEMTFDDLKRKDALKNNDKIDDAKEGDEDFHEEKLPTWHQETSKPTKSFLQFDLEQGTKTDLLGEGVRDSEDGDQALGIIQGSSQKSSKNDFSKMEAIEANHSEKDTGGSGFYGKENKFAQKMILKPIKPTPEDYNNYDQHKSMILPYQKKLKQLIEKTLDHKKVLPRGDLHFGRLSKRLVRLLTDENPRMFYKKNQPSPEIDAVFSLLVDCSASMYDKMDQSKLGITLFHEALKSLFVPHEITGFWEDTSEASETYQPNYFKTVIDFQSSIQKTSGVEIMQLQPEEDNRDGFSIRVASERLMLRNEKQKFLIVFSDGEPAAFDYEQNGIVDTHEAVLNARKKGIEVINVFLSNGEIEESHQKTIENIYGKYSILVPDINELPNVMFPLLKKLLLKSL
ncbi:hypothetical protein LCL95_04440 [Bacillus timonensis]|nr:hypothetical protein [Bacillus timonensis]